MNAVQWAVGRIAARAQNERSKSDVILIITLQTISGNMPIRCWGHLTCIFPQLAKGHTLCAVFFTHTILHHIASSFYIPQIAVRVSFCWWLQSMFEKPIHLCSIGRKHRKLSIQHCSREIKWKAVHTQPGFEGYRKTNNFKNHTQEETKSMEQVYPLKRSEKAAESLNRLNKGITLLKPVYKD